LTFLENLLSYLFLYPLQGIPSFLLFATIFEPTRYPHPLKFPVKGEKSSTKYQNHHQLANSPTPQIYTSPIPSSQKNYFSSLGYFARKFRESFFYKSRIKLP
jgi:hypothetical protein